MIVNKIFASMSRNICINYSL